MLFPVDFPNESDANDCWNQPARHHDGSAIAEFGGDKGATQDPNNLERTLGDP